MMIPGPTTKAEEVRVETLSPAKSEQKIFEYTLVSSTKKEEFETKCTQKLYDRWEPVGGVFVANILFVKPAFYQSFRRVIKR